jgi:hypothetical protein
MGYDDDRRGFVTRAYHGTVPDQVPLLHETAKMLFQRAAAGTGDADPITDVDAAMRMVDDLARQLGQRGDH